MSRRVKRSLGGVVVLACVVAVLLPIAASSRGDSSRGDISRRDRGAANDAATRDSRFVVHEWGTFTNFSGSDGVNLEFRPTVDNELPDFVYDRWLQSVQSLPTKATYRTRQRMETPVTYFYTDHQRDVEVRVDFPQGLLTEFYPPVRAFGPEMQWQEAVAAEKSFLDWGKVRLIPEQDFRTRSTRDLHGRTTPARIPTVTGGDHYAYARETDSAVVTTKDAYGGEHFEKFLFYRGIGSFKLPLKLEALGGGRFAVTNFGADPIESLFLVQIDGTSVRYSLFPQLAPHAVMYITESTAASTVENLAEDMVTALTATGLYEKEARSMVKTWRSSWFGEQGTRLLYIVPPKVTDEVLPIKISPRPDELVRVLVGRSEIVTPEQAAEFAGLIRRLGTCLSTCSEPLRGELARLGRFAEPTIEHVLATGAADDVTPQLRWLLDEVRPRK